MSASGPKPSREDLWKQYELQVDLYKAYLDATIKLNGWYYAISGAIMSFYFSKSDVALLKWSLLLPLFLSIGLTILFFAGAWLLEASREDVFRLRDELGMQVAPEFRVLGYLLCIFGAIAAFVAMSLIWFMFLRKAAG